MTEQSKPIDYEIFAHDRQTWRGGPRVEHQEADDLYRGLPPAEFVAEMRRRRELGFWQWVAALPVGDWPEGANAPAYRKDPLGDFARDTRDLLGMDIDPATRTGRFKWEVDDTVYRAYCELARRFGVGNARAQDVLARHDRLEAKSWAEMARTLPMLLDDDRPKRM